MTGSLIKNKSTKLLYLFRKTKLITFFSILFYTINSCLAQIGSLDLSFDPGSGANGIVNATSIQNDGKILIGGYFTTYNGTARNYIARLNLDGSLDTTFNPGSGANNWVESISIQNDGKIILGGNFLSYNGTARKGIVRLNSNGSLDSTFNPGTGADWVYSTSIQNDGKIIIGGRFHTYNGVARKFVARINSNGSLDNSFNPGIGADAFVASTAIQNDGKIIIGGAFNTFNGLSRNYLTRLNSDGSIDTTFTIGWGLDGYVYSIAIQSDEKIIIGGGFLTYNLTPRKFIARLNTDGSLDNSFNPGTGASALIYSASIQTDGKIIIGGNFQSYNGTTRKRIARLNINGSLDFSFDPGTGVNAFIKTTSIQNDGRIIIAGDFIQFNGTSINRIARLYAADTNDTATAVFKTKINETKDIQVFPNPFSSTSTLHSDFELINAVLTIFNSLGQPVRKIENVSGRTKVIERGNLPVGIYIVKLSQDDQIILTDKLIISD